MSGMLLLVELPKRMAGEKGLEPSFSPLTAECITIMLLTNIWSGLGDLNSRSFGWQPSALDHYAKPRYGCKRSESNRHLDGLWNRWVTNTLLCKTYFFRRQLFLVAPRRVYIIFFGLLCASLCYKYIQESFLVNFKLLVFSSF